MLSNQANWEFVFEFTRNVTVPHTLHPALQKSVHDPFSAWLGQLGLQEIISQKCMRASIDAQASYNTACPAIVDIATWQHVNCLGRQFWHVRPLFDLRR